MEEIKKAAEKYAILNAAEYGRACIKAVASRVFAEFPEARKSARDVIEVIRKVVESVNSLEREEILKLAKKYAPEEKKEKKKHALPELPVSGKPVFRIAPNPNGPLHIGHARMVILNDEYAKRYNGELILRFDDTDPKNPAKRPVKEAYEMIREDLKWLGVSWSKEIIASQRLEIYYEHFKTCLENGIAYICTCDAEEWRERARKRREACECRERDREENLRLWEKMLSGELREGEAVGRIKTSLGEKDPAVIDWVAFRIVDNPVHPLFEGKETPKVWPTLDFASAIDDKLCGVTHIIRGKDLAISEKRQKILYSALGWEYPKVFVFGKIFSEKYVFSTSKIRECIEKGEYSGFDDPRLATLRALRKRGITPQAIRNYIISLGLNENETKFDEEILYAENRKILDPVAKRYFFVKEPIKIELDDLPFEKIEAPFFPRKDSEKRSIRLSKTVFIEKEDFERFKGKEVRLMHFCNVVLDEKAKVTSVENKDIPKIHWVCNPIEAKLILPDKVYKGYAEENVKNVKKDEIVQFERVGFARCDEKLVFYFAHR